MRALVGHPEIAHLLGVALVFTAGHMILVPTLGIMTKQWYDFDQGAKTMAFCAWMFFGILIQGGAIRPTVKRIGERSTFLVGSLILAVGFGIVAAHPPVGLFWIAAILIAIGGSLADPALRGLLSRITSEGDHGAAQGLHQSTMALGRSIAYFGGGYLFSGFGPAMAYKVAAGAVIVGCVLLLLRKTQLQATDPN